MAPLLAELIESQRASGLPPSYLVKVKDEGSKQS
jgi:hypothetical protein